MGRFRLVLISFGVAALLYSCQHSDRDHTAPREVPAAEVLLRWKTYSENRQLGDRPCFISLMVSR